MADLVYSLVKGPAGWVLFLDGARFGGIYEAKEAAFEAAMVAASFAIRCGAGVQINVPGEANMPRYRKASPWPKEWMGLSKNEALPRLWNRPTSWRIK